VYGGSIGASGRHEPLAFSLLGSGATSGGELLIVTLNGGGIA
jgi:hypothetical protein